MVRVFRVLVSVLGCRVWGFAVWGLEFGVLVSGLRGLGLGLRFSALGLRFGV